MKTKSMIIALLLGVGIVASWGCGGGTGSPGSSGSDDTGIQLEATITPTYDGANTKSVDAVQDICSEGPPPVYEKFKDHTATVTINARLVNPNAQFTPGVLFVEKYTVSYVRSNDSIGAPPIESDTRFDSTIIIAPPTGTGVTTVTATIDFLDLIRKIKYADDIAGGQFSSGPAFLNNYTAIFTFEGHNAFGKAFSFKVQTDFQIGDFNNC
jgi:hypothetical protein